MRFVVKACVALGLSLGSVSARAAEVPPKVFIAGTGHRNCAEIYASTELKKQAGDWALGFWSALNYVAAVTKEQDQLMISPEQMLQEIDKACAQRSSRTLADTVWVLFLTRRR